ncbi:MAG TPA: redox-regulated ATPase YchF [Candidatus Dojkabacteria bacterium]|jgi:hypothetical protein
MKLAFGIVGLPNVGKSTLFNTLTLKSVPAENFPFCTIDPNVGVVPVKDLRLDRLEEIEDSESKLPAVLEFVDIAGLIKGAHKGEGLGNKFLSNIKSVDAIIHVVRNFRNDTITHVNNKIDPKDDIEIINTELILKDMETVEARLKKIERDAHRDKEVKIVFDYIDGLKNFLASGNLAKDFQVHKEEFVKNERASLFLLTDKPIIYLVNTIDMDQADEELKMNLGLKAHDVLMQMDIKTENEIFTMDESDRAEYMKDLGIEEPGIDKLTRLAYKTLGLISFFTSGKKEVRAWTIELGTNLRDAAGVIHNDFRDKFIAADVVSFENFDTSNGWNGSKSNGKVRLEGKEYIVKDGDVIIFRHGA